MVSFLLYGYLLRKTAVLEEVGKKSSFLKKTISTRTCRSGKTSDNFGGDN